MFKGASPFADYVDAELLFVVGLSLLVLLGILIAMVYFIVRYSRKRNPTASNIEGNLTLEVLWTVIPLTLFMYMFYVGWEGYKVISHIPEGALPIKVTARMWAWTFEYPDGLQADTLYVPVNTPMKLTLRSMDVNHSLFIPAFRIKKDVIPNRDNTMWFKTPRVASYNIACAEYCGLRHSYMYSKVVAMDSSDFERWYQAASLRQGKTYTPMLGSGQGATRQVAQQPL
jgi:cytochrome c oxidase subunit II